jgi:hypothetical protein
MVHIPFLLLISPLWTLRSNMLAFYAVLVKAGNIEDFT